VKLEVLRTVEAFKADFGRRKWRKGVAVEIV
jgi:hypothetical protein